MTDGGARLSSLTDQARDGHDESSWVQQVGNKYPLPVAVTKKIIPSQIWGDTEHGDRLQLRGTPNLGTAWRGDSPSSNGRPSKSKWPGILPDELFDSAPRGWSPQGLRSPESEENQQVDFLVNVNEAKQELVEAEAKIIVSGWYQY
jgi:hypothetical protein